MVDHEHRTDTPDTDPIPVQSAVPPQANGPRPAMATTAAVPPEVRRTRISGLWVGVTVAAIVLLVLLVFIIQNGQSVTISIFGGSLHLPLGVALLLAAICGVLLVAVPGYGRIFQLRRAVRRAGNTEQVR
ncbi:MAG TPA: lipopolysaccharide assembly protein LapA domain-containing protein [Pseudonocardiaceae bacterium]|jgi:uncharacterized integral membrane protein